MYCISSNHEKKSGFTLVELLIVVAIMGILAAVGVVSYTGFMESARENATRANHEQILRYYAATIAKCEIGPSTVIFRGVETICDPSWGGINYAQLAQSLEGSRGENCGDVCMSNPYFPNDRTIETAPIRFGRSACDAIANFGQTHISGTNAQIDIVTRLEDNNDGSRNCITAVVLPNL